jgi:hypothetical protein
MPRVRLNAAKSDNGPATEGSPGSGISEKSSGLTSGISRKRLSRPVRCVVPKLLKLTLAESEALKELAAAWGISASDVLKRLLMNAHLERRAQK